MPRDHADVAIEPKDPVKEVTVLSCSASANLVRVLQRELDVGEPIPHIAVLTQCHLSPRWRPKRDYEAEWCLDLEEDLIRHAPAPPGAPGG